MLPVSVPVPVPVPVSVCWAGMAARGWCRAGAPAAAAGAGAGLLGRVGGPRLVPGWRSRSRPARPVPPRLTSPAARAPRPSPVRPGACPRFRQSPLAPERAQLWLNGGFLTVNGGNEQFLLQLCTPGEPTACRRWRPPTSGRPQPAWRGQPPVSRADAEAVPPVAAGTAAPERAPASGSPRAGACTTVT